METVTKATLAAHLCANGLTKQDAKAFVDSFFSVIHDALASGDEVRISGFGNFKLRDKKSRPGRNPKTGEEVMVQARRVVTFKASQKLRADLAKGLGVSPEAIEDAHEEDSLED